MVARLISVNEDTELSDLHDVFQQVLGWGGDLGYSFRIHGKEFNSFRVARDLSHCESFACIAKRSSSTSATCWTCGSGSSGSWTFRKARRPKTQILFAWAVVAPRLRRVAVGPEAIG
jgi:Plasmid pRiA4b ORF-3-like protein.